MENVRPIIAKNADRASTLMTDESPIYPKVGKTFGFHDTVNHSANEYVRLGAFIHINTAESFFSIVKRGNMGVYHSVSEAHQGSIWRRGGFRRGLQRRNREATGVQCGHS